ncbi:cystathionine beta-lyase [Sphingomonas lutea]|uniref:Cystathionine beta-lyase n=1 Tax=Sphingomonas lutea TaxID=1045317 RepID=A0A7G9SFR0_9SPHN|nr:cystathionine beta-lyase [Sphingomonas lutea]QNN66685.1 cystathionine beta-lyase [Sphingomonas lutea]
MTDPPHRDATRLVEAGRRKAWRGRLVNPPVERASTILFDSVAELDGGQARLGEYRYGLQGTATHWALSDALTELEPGAAGTALFSSGLSAITTALLAVLRSGDELLVTDSVYGPTRKFCDTLLGRYGVATRYYDPLVGAGIAELIVPSTRAILLESPGTLTMEVQDVPAICAVARERGIVTLIDNTWATPLLFPALAAGVDISIMALTKYVGGHADVMLGSVTAGEAHFDRLQTISWDLGHAVSPDDAFLASRGLRTMGLRLKQHEANAREVANWLAEQPQVGRMLHPAFDSCPGHDNWVRDFKGSSGLFSFEFRGDEAARRRFIDSLELFGIGYSWGGFESLVLPADPVRTVSEPPAANLVRLHVGLEDPRDLIADLANAFKAAA